MPFAATVEVIRYPSMTSAFPEPPVTEEVSVPEL